MPRAIADSDDEGDDPYDDGEHASAPGSRNAQPEGAVAEAFDSTDERSTGSTGKMHCLIANQKIPATNCLQNN